MLNQALFEKSPVTALERQFVIVNQGIGHYPSVSKNRSASIAAMQPVPAAVIACR